MEDINRNSTPYQKKSLRGASNNEKFAGISILNFKETILKNVNISFIVNFCFDKYSFIFSLFEHTLYFEEN